MKKIQDIHIDQIINYCFGRNYKTIIERHPDGWNTITPINTEGELIRPVTIYAINKRTNNSGKMVNVITFEYSLLPDEIGYEHSLSYKLLGHHEEDTFLNNVRQ